MAAKRVRGRPTRSDEGGLYLDVFDHAPVAYVLLDGEGAIVEINRAAVSLLGDPLHGVHFAECVRAEATALLATLLSAPPAAPDATRCELELRQDGGSRPVRITASTLPRDEPMVLLALEDLTEERAQRLEQARREQVLRDQDRRKDTFIAMLSHELRNPLAPIRTSIGVLQLAPPGSEASRGAIAIIDRASARLARLVEDMLDITRITQGKLEQRQAPVELCALVRGAVDEHRTSSEQPLELRCEVPELWLEVDGARLAQIVTTLIGNAAKVTPAGGRIRVIVGHADGTAILAVNGIAPERGVELANVEALVGLLGGQIALVSDRTGRGTEVVVRLPALATPRQPATLRRRVVIVEDVRDNAHALQQALELRGHDVKVAYDGKTGLELTASYAPDIVLCDLGLPDLDGFALARRLRATHGAGLYLVALGSHVRGEDLARAKAAGFDHHIAKPAPLDDLDRVFAALPARR